MQSFQKHVQLQLDANDTWVLTAILIYFPDTTQFITSFHIFEYYDTGVNHGFDTSA